LTNEYVPVLLVGSNAHGPFGAMSPLPTTVVLVAAAAGATPVSATPAVVASIVAITSKAPALLRIRKVLFTL
jgi:hypothetical protein